jgi:hypothetical protein
MKAWVIRRNAQPALCEITRPSQAARGYERLRNKHVPRRNARKPTDKFFASFNSLCVPLRCKKRIHLRDLRGLGRSG